MAMLNNQRVNYTGWWLVYHEGSTISTGPWLQVRKTTSGHPCSSRTQWHAAAIASAVASRPGLAPSEKDADNIQKQVENAVIQSRMRFQATKMAKCPV